MIHELFEKQVEQTPEKTALFFEDSQLTYRELNDRADKLACQLRALGVGPDVLVALLIERSLDMVVGMLGILKAGGAYIPLDPSHPGSRIVSVLEDAKPLLLLTDHRSASTLPPHRTRSVMIDGTTPAKVGDGEPRHEPSPRNLAYVIYTSGSTGKPKGVEIEHGAVINFLASMKRQPGLSAGDTMLAITTLAFDIAVLEIVLPLVCGAAVVIASTETARDGAALADLMQRRGVSVIQATPSTFRLLLDAGWMGSPQLKILCGGEAWSAELAKPLLARSGSLWNMYGPTETTIWSAIAKVEEARPVAIGLPIANTKLYVLDRALQLVPLGVPGELCIGGMGLARGYLHRPELTRERFVPDPYSEQPGARIYRTGDLVRRQTGGMLEFLGRLDHQVKLRGHRIELGEIEATLEQHANIKQCAVVVPEEAGTERQLVAYFIPLEDSVVSKNDLQQWLSERLPSYMIPSVFVSLSSFPLNPSGKVDRKALPSPDRAAQKDAQSLAPRSQAEEILARVWCEVLGLSEVGVRDDFFTIGGNSILVAQTIGKLNQAFGTKLNASAVFRAPTIETLAAVVEQNRLADEHGAKVVLFRYGNKGVPLYFMGAGPVEYRISQLMGGDRAILAIDVPIPAEWRGAINAMDGSAHPTFEKLGELYGAALHKRIGSSPCVIAGYSFSGKVAFEAAHAMRRAGGTVALVLLIDAFTWTGATRVTALRLFSLIWRSFSAENAKGYSYVGKLFAALKKSSQLFWWLILQMPGVLKPRMSTKMSHPTSLVDSEGMPLDEFALRKLNRLVGRAYFPELLDTRGVLIRAHLPHEAVLPEVDVTNGWCDLFLHGVEVVQVAGDHLSIIRNDQNAAEMADKITAVLNRFDLSFSSPSEESHLTQTNAVLNTNRQKEVSHLESLGLTSILRS